MDSQPPRFSTCSVVGCESAGVRGLSCSFCKRFLCAAHLVPAFHTCNTVLDDEAWEEQIHLEISDLLSRVNVQELTDEASRLRGRGRCEFVPGKYIGAGAIMGCANYHGWLVFDDEKWLVRIPRAGFSDVPEDLVEYLVLSEYATLKFLGSTKLPVPTVFGCGLSSDPNNRVGVSYLLMQPLPGTPYLSYRATADQKAKVLGQLADALIEISKYPLPNAGSLLVEKGEVEVSSFASNRFVALHRYGPLNNALEYFVATAEQYLDLISDGQLYHEYPMDAFYFYFIFREHADRLVGDETQNKFFVKHVDDKGDHILIDDSGNITGIIDWQFARCVPASEAFGPSYFTADMGALYSGKVAITDDDKRLAQELRARGASDLAAYMEQDPFVRSFIHGLGSGMTRDEVCQIIDSVAAALKTRGLWKNETRKGCENDPRWQRLKARTCVDSNDG